MRNQLLIIITLISLVANGQTISSVNPQTAERGTVHLPITITGNGTNFSNATTTMLEIRQGTSTLIVDSIYNYSATQIAALISIPNTYPLGSYDVGVYDQSVGGIVQGLGAFTVTANLNPPVSTHVTPEFAGEGATLPITISMQNAHFTQATNSTMFLTQGTSTVLYPVPGSLTVLNDDHIRAHFDLSPIVLGGNPDSLLASVWTNFDGSFTAPNKVYVLPSATINGSLNYSGTYDGLVEVYQENPGMNPSTYSLIGSTVVQNNNYSIPNIPMFTNLLLRSVPVGVSDVVATYYPDQIAWQNSTSVMAISSPSGPYVITPYSAMLAAQQGAVVNGAIGFGPNGFFKANTVMAEGVEVFILDVNNNQVAQTVTDANGLYSFNNIANGSYEIVIDIPGYSQVSTYSFTVNSSSDVIEDLDFLIDNGEIFTSNFMGLQPLSDEKLEVYPNPTTGQIVVNLPDANEEMTLALLTLSGETVMSYAIQSGVSNTSINFGGVANGVYILRLSYDKGVQQTRIVKNN